MRKLVLTILVWGFSTVQASSLTWRADLDDESTWSRLTYAGTLLSATEKSLSHFDPGTGELLWQRNDLNKLAQFNVNDVFGTPFLVISERLSNRPARSRLQVLNISTGETLWDTDEFAGKGLGVYAVPEANLLVSVAEFEGKKAGVYVVGYSLESGAEAWRTRLGRKGSIPTHRSDIGGLRNTRDLSGHPRPVITDGQMILAVGDLIAIDLASGEQRWRFKLKASAPELKNTYAQPIVAGNIVYAASKSRIHAVDIASGAERWKAKVSRAPIPQLELVGNLIIGRLGGTFSDGKGFVRSGPFGAFAVDRTTGKLAWKWTRARDSVTNLRVQAEQGLVLLADKKKLYALDLNATKKPNVVYQYDLEFKRKMGKADIAAKGIGAVGGLLSGGIAGGLQGLGGGDRGDPPLEVDVVGDRLIVRAQYHVLSHDLETRSPDWSIEFAPPGINTFALIAMGVVTVAVAADQAGSARQGGGAWDNRGILGTTLGVTSSFQSAVAARYAAAEKARWIAFFLTTEEEGMVLLGIDLGDGSEIGRIPMDEKEPQFMVDVIGSRVYYFRNKTELLAYDF